MPRIKRKVSRRRLSKKSTTKKKPKTTARAKPRRRLATVGTGDLKAQLEIYKNPHSLSGVQPKIPDGKLSRSLGLSNQAAGELVAFNGTPPAGQESQTKGDGTIHIVLYAGQNSAAICLNTVNATKSLTQTTYNSAGPVGEPLGWEGSPDINFGSGGLNPTSGGSVNTLFEYSGWRTVSTGIVLDFSILLNLTTVGTNPFD